MRALFFVASLSAFPSAAAVHALPGPRDDAPGEEDLGFALSRKGGVLDSEGILARFGLLLHGPYSHRFSEVCAPDLQATAAWAEYARFHAQCRQNPACVSRALIWRCKQDELCGGLGDEIKGFAFTFWAAVAAKRPIFVQWTRMGQNMLEFLAAKDIDVRLPDMPLSCESDRFIDPSMETAVSRIGGARTSKSCMVWMTNADIWTLWEKKRAKFSQSFQHIPTEAAIGCAMNFMFQSAALSPIDRANFMHVPESFVAVHLRCKDEDMGGKTTGQVSNQERGNVQRALKCAKRILKSDNVVFVSCSESGKLKALESANGTGVNVNVANAPARHVDHDHARVSEEELRRSLWSDFIVLQQASGIVFVNGSSGFSRSAASIAFMPADRIMTTSQDSPPCVPFDPMR